MNQAEKVIARIEGGVGYVTFNNPERHNAMSLDMWSATARILEAFRANQDIRAVVLTGAGGRAFVSGADVSRFGEERADEAAIARYSATVEAAHIAIYDYPKPTIAMIHGYCIGGGLGLAVTCDLRICADNSRFAVPAAKLGLGYSYPGLKRLVDLVGPSYAKEIFFTARQFDAAEALSMGLVNRVLPADEVEPYVRNYAEVIAGNAPLTIRAAKFGIGQAVKDGEKDLAAAEELVDQCFQSKDYIEGRAAFMEKRKPAFTGS